MLVTPFSAFGLSAWSVLMLDYHVYTVMLESFQLTSSQGRRIILHHFHIMSNLLACLGHVTYICNVYVQK